MDSAMIWEWVGYLASVVVAISLMMSDIKKLRWLNLFGAMLFVAYGMAIQAYPVAAVNFFIVLIDLYYLIKIYRESSS
ncbi:MAG: YgjV family protein, partial [Shewanella sp.]